MKYPEIPTFWGFWKLILVENDNNSKFCIRALKIFILKVENGNKI
jgi:hypothetical protein